MGTSADLAPELGATVTPEGVDFAVYAGHADGVEICLFDAHDPAGDSEKRIALQNRAHGTWFGSVPGIGAGARYGVRAHGLWHPSQGLRYNPSKLLLDPYARAVEGEVSWCPEVFGHFVDGELVGDPDVRDGRNSAPYVPRAVVVDDGFAWGDDAPPMVPWAQTVIYEAHVRNLTQRHPLVPEHLRGTYAGMAHPAVIEHLQLLGVSAVELLPVHVFTHEPELVRRGLRNHWGYNTLGFFAPHGPYAASRDPQGQLDEFKAMVRQLHAAGLEVILDVVYNHTCEQGRAGGTLSWRGLDNRAYYRLDERGHDIDVTGCGNTLDLRHPVVDRMVLDSLRYWVEHCHVDGFRFDLAVTLGRGRDDAYHPNNPFLVALRTDPVLSRVKLIAEPWDLGVHGWRTGQFPPPFGEWNDRFRDGVRTFWLRDLARSSRHEPGHGVSELATRLSGSQDLFGSRDRGPIASINYVAAHDGYTLADTTTYELKHNQRNGEGNRDGQDDNRSWNHGLEGLDASLQAARRRSMRNLLASGLLASGVPMLNSGDELGRSQGGNNNTYCQDNETSWLDWDLQAWQRDLLATTCFLTNLRATSPVLGQRSYFTGRLAHQEGMTDFQWFGADGQPMRQESWDDPHTRTLAMFLDSTTVGGQSLLIIFHGGAWDAEVTLPARGQGPGKGGRQGHGGHGQSGQSGQSLPAGRGRVRGQGPAYRLLWDSAQELPPASAGPGEAGPVTVTAASVRVYRVVF